MKTLFKRRWPIVILVILLMVGVAAAKALKSRSPAPVVPAAAAPVLEFLAADLIRIQTQDLRQVLAMSGALRALNQAAVKAKVAGEVREVLVREGESVSAGQILVRTDVTEYQARVDQAKGALQAARGQLDIAVKARDNNRALLTKGFISQNAFDNAASQYEIAQANVESAKGALDVAQKALADTVIRAPISGLVSSRTVQPGEKVSADNHLLDVVDLRQMELEAMVPTSDIALVRLGQDVTMHIEGIAQAVSGKVTRINPAIQAGSRSIAVYVQVDNPDTALRAGMFADAQLTLAKKSAVLAVPLSAIQSNGGSTSVYAIEAGKLVQKPVTLGIRGDANGEAVEILSGLENGAQIVRNNLGNLRPGAQVQIAKPDAAPAAAGQKS